MDFDFTAIFHGYTHFSQLFPTIIFGLNKITVSVFADFSNAAVICIHKRKNPDPPRRAQWAAIYYYSVCRHLSTYL